MTTVKGSAFHVFDDSSDEEAEEPSERDAKALAKARSLVEQANIKTMKSITSAKVSNITDPNDSYCMGEWDRNELPWDEPVFMGPIQITSCPQVGGGRGAVATRELPAGTLVLIEDPMVRWSDDDDDTAIGTSILELVFSRASDVRKMIHNTEYLHPTKASLDLPSSQWSSEVRILMAELKILFEKDERMDRLLNELKSSRLTSDDGTELTHQDLLRLMLVIRLNGLESGLYCFTAMLNHADQPNSVKFKGEKYSEVRTTRTVQPGEMLTISYVPRIRSHANRRHYLWQQHRFDIGTSPPSDLLAMEFISHDLPPSWPDRVDAESATSRIETTISDLEGLLDGMKLSKEYSESFSLEQATLELLRVAESELSNANHILLIPILHLHIDSCDLVQRVPTLSLSDRKKLLCRLIESAYRLRFLLARLYGEDHFDIAAAELDVAQSLDELLNTSPKFLVSTKIIGLPTIEQYSSLALNAWRNHYRIKALYPKDVDDIVERKRSGY